MFQGRKSVILGVRAARRPFQKVGGFAPDLFQGSPGPRDRQDPQHDIFFWYKNIIAIQSAATQ